MITNEKAKERSFIWSIKKREDYLQAEDLYNRNVSFKDLFIDTIEYVEKVSLYTYEELAESFYEMLDDENYEDAYETLLTLALEEDF